MRPGTVLNPASPLFREARYLLAAERELHDLGLHHSVLATIAAGNTTRGAIGTYTGRTSGDLVHPLNVVMDCGLVHRRPGAFRDNRSTYEIAEPLITFYHAVMRPIWSDLAHARDLGAPVGTQGTQVHRRRARAARRAAVPPLDQVRLLTARGYRGAAAARLLCFSGAGFSPDLTARPPAPATFGS